VKEKAWILSGLEKSSNPIIAFYAKLEVDLGPPGSDHEQNSIH